MVCLTCGTCCVTCESLGLHSCAKKHGWMQEGQMSSSSHESIMREAHACSFCVENDDLNKAKKLLLAFSSVGKYLPSGWDNHMYNIYESCSWKMQLASLLAM